MTCITLTLFVSVLHLVIFSCNASTTTPAPFPLTHGRENYTLPPTHPPTRSETSTTTVTINCYHDSCNQSTVSNSISPSTEPSQLPTAIQWSTFMSSFNNTHGQAKDGSTADEGYAWNDPLVLAIGLLGTLVLILTCMVTIFGCMAYSKSKENMRIADKLKVSMMRDSSYLKVNGDPNDNSKKNLNYNNGNASQKGKHFATDYRNVRSTDEFLAHVHGHNHNHDDHRDRLESEVPGSLSNVDSPAVLIQMNKGINSNNNNTGYMNTGPIAQGEIVNINANSRNTNVNNSNKGIRNGNGNANIKAKHDDDDDDDDDDDANGNIFNATPGGGKSVDHDHDHVQHVSTDDIIANVENEGQGSAYGYGNYRPKKSSINVDNISELKSASIRSISSMNNDHEHDNGDINFVQGLNNGAAASVFTEEDIVQHMATAGSVRNLNENQDNQAADERDRGDSIQLQFD